MLLENDGDHLFRKDNTAAVLHEPRNRSFLYRVETALGLKLSLIIYF